MRTDRRADCCDILMKFEFSRQIIEIYPDIKLHDNLSSGSRVFHVGGRTDRHD